MEAYTLRRPRRAAQNNSTTAPSSPISRTLINSHQSYFRSVPGSPANPRSFSEQAPGANSSIEFDTTFEFKFMISGAGNEHDSQQLPLKLPPRLQSPSRTPPRPVQGAGTPKRSLLGFGGLKNKDFDPFVAAVERIRCEEGGHISLCREERSGKHKRSKSALLAFGGSNSDKKRVFEEDRRMVAKHNGLMQNEDSFSSRLEAIEESRSTSSASYKQNLLACFRFKK